MLLASTPPSARAARCHGLQIVNASRIAVFFGESIQVPRWWKSASFRARSTLPRNPGGVPFFSRGGHVVLRSPGKQCRGFVHPQDKPHPPRSTTTPPPPHYAPTRTTSPT